MLCVLDLIHQIIDMSPRDFAQRFGLNSVTAAHHQRMDFDHWLRNCLTPGRKFVSLDEARAEYLNSFGLPNPDEKGPQKLCVLDLIHQIIDMSPRDFAERFGLNSVTAAHHQRMDFDHWLRNCLTPGRKFVSLDEARAEYIKSFG